MRWNCSGRGCPSVLCSFHCQLWVKPWRIYRYPSCIHPPEMIFDQSLIYFDLPVCPATQVGLVLLHLINACNLKNSSSKVSKRVCMARGRSHVEAWMGTPDKVDFCSPIYSVRHLCFLWKDREREKEHLEAFAQVKGKNGDLRFLSLNCIFFSFPEGRLQNLFNQLTWCLTKTVKTKFETITFWCL
jgi:hypothetical protein